MNYDTFSDTAYAPVIEQDIVELGNLIGNCGFGVNPATWARISWSDCSDIFATTLVYFKAFFS